jgi:hypothetical protein
MAANYSTNPSNPMNQNGGQPQGNEQANPYNQIGTPVMTQPKSIRDYLELVRSQQAAGQNVAPSFTNRFGGEGFFVGDEPQQAIPEGPQSEYESHPFSERVKMDPWDRATNRVQQMLPDIWQQVFPNRPQGSTLSDAEMKQWNEAVQTITGSLIQRYDKQYEWFLKNQKTLQQDRDKDRKFWQAKFVDAQLRGQPARKPDGSPMSEAEFVNERMSAADELKYQDFAEKEMETERKAKSELTPETVAAAMKKNKELARAIRLKIKSLVEDGVGRKLTDDEYRELMKNPDAQDLMNEASEGASNYYSDQIQQVK